MTALDGLQRVGDYPLNWDQPLRIEAKLHRVVLTSGRNRESSYSYSSIQQALGGLHRDKSYGPETGRHRYRMKLLREFGDFSVVLFIHPTDYRPRCEIRIHPKGEVTIRRYREFLAWLNDRLPKLQVSKVEYTSDQYCLGPNAVRFLYEVERRWLYVPNQRTSASHQKEDTEEISAAIEVGETPMNFTFYAGSVKMYERGPDKRRRGRGWAEEDIDRLRFEHTAKREELKRNGIQTLSDLIEDAKFFRINQGLYNFRDFVGSNQLPKAWDGYIHPDKHGNADSFQLECIHYRKIIKNLMQYTEDADGFEALTSRLEDVWKEFDREWKT